MADAAPTEPTAEQPPAAAPAPVMETAASTEPVEPALPLDRHDGNIEYDDPEGKGMQFCAQALYTGLPCAFVICAIGLALGAVQIAADDKPTVKGTGLALTAYPGSAAWPAATADIGFFINDKRARVCYGGVPANDWMASTCVNVSHGDLVCQELLRPLRQPEGSLKVQIGGYAAGCLCCVIVIAITCRRWGLRNWPFSLLTMLSSTIGMLGAAAAVAALRASVGTQCERYPAASPLYALQVLRSQAVLGVNASSPNFVLLSASLKELGFSADLVWTGVSTGLGAPVVAIHMCLLAVRLHMGWVNADRGLPA